MRATIELPAQFIRELLRGRVCRACSRGAAAAAGVCTRSSGRRAENVTPPIRLVFLDPTPFLAFSTPTFRLRLFLLFLLFLRFLQYHGDRLFPSFGHHLVRGAAISPSPPLFLSLLPPKYFAKRRSPPRRFLRLFPPRLFIAVVYIFAANAKQLRRRRNENIPGRLLFYTSFEIAL